MIEIVRHTQRDVKRWQDADTTERSTDTAVRRRARYRLIITIPV